MEKDCPYIHSQKKGRSIRPKEKGKGKESEQEKLTVAIVNSANYRPMTTSQKLLQFEPAMNSHLKAEGNLKQTRRSKMPMKGTIAFERNFRLKREASNSHARVWREQDSERNFHLWT